MLSSMRNLFPENAQAIEDRGFSRLHKAVLKLEYGNLEDYVKTYSSMIDSTDASGYTALMWAARRNDRNAIHTLVKAGADVNSRTKDAGCALHYAAGFCDFEIVKVLIEAGADPCLVDKYGDSPLHFVRHTTANSAKMIECLVEAGADPSLQDSYGVTPLHTCTLNDNVEAARAFLDHGASVNTVDHDGDSVLSQCFLTGANDVAELLLLRGATYTVWDSMGNSILHLAALSGNLRTIDVLHRARLHTINPDVVNRQGQTALQVAKARVSKTDGFVEKLQELLVDIRIRNAEMRRNEAKMKETAPVRPKIHSDNKPLSFGFRRLRYCGLRDVYRKMTLILGNLPREFALACLLLAFIFYGFSFIQRSLEFGLSRLYFAHVWFGPGDFVEL